MAEPTLEELCQKVAAARMAKTASRAELARASASEREATNALEEAERKLASHLDSVISAHIQS